MSSFEQKVKVVADFLPPNKEIFIASAQFETVQQVPQAIKSKYFDDNIKEIAKMLTEAAFKDKNADQIEELDVISQLEDWLTGGEVKFKLRKKQQPKQQKVERVEKRQEMVAKQPQSGSSQLITQQKPQRIQIQQQQQYPHHQQIQHPYQNQPMTTSPYPQQQQSRPQSYYQTPPPQGRQNTIKYNAKQPQMPHPNNGYTKEQLNVKRAAYQKSNVMWIDSLSKCLTFPQKRFYLLPEMHARRKY